MAATTRERVPADVSLGRIARYGLAAVATAVVANALVLALALALLETGGFAPLDWMPVLTASAIGAAGATAVYALLARISERPNRTFTIVAAVVFVLSFGTIVQASSFPGATTATLSVLVVMHTVVAVASVGLLRRAGN